MAQGKREEEERDEGERRKEKKKRTTTCQSSVEVPATRGGRAGEVAQWDGREKDQRKEKGKKRSFFLKKNLHILKNVYTGKLQ